MNNNVTVEFEKTIRTYKYISNNFSSRFTEEQVLGWLRSTLDFIDEWESKLSWYNDGRDISESLNVGLEEFDEGNGDDDCPYDDEIQEWINENQDQ